MKLKLVISSLEEVDETFRAMYKKRDSDGKYVLEVEGAVEKARLDEFRENNLSMKQQLDALKDIDPARYRELLELDTKVKEKKLIESGRIDELVEGRIKTMRTEHEKIAKDLTDQLSVSNKQLEVLLIDNAVKSAAIASGVLPSAVDDVVLRAKATFVLDKGVPIIKNDKGEVVYGEDGTTPMSVASWTKGLQKSAPHLFAGAQGSGATGSGAASKQTGNMSAVEKIAAGLASVGAN